MLLELTRSLIAAEFVRVLDAHPLLDGAAELQEALAHLLDGEFVEGPEAAVAQMVDVVDVGSFASRGGP